MATEVPAGNILPIDIAEEMQRSYIDYAMSVIVDRALPDVRDGLKPVQRRILFGMSELGLRPDRPHKKSARIVGEVMGKFHPHGDSAIYDSMVHLAQDFATRYMLVDGHGNFGSVDGDPPAAMRYTEARLSHLGMEMLRDIDKDTVDFVPNFDETQEQPAVLPSRFPNLLVNGSQGIAVGMATKIPPHNLGEIIDGLVLMIDQPEVDPADLMRLIKGPDFPTGGIILGREGIREAYRTGRGRIRVRARIEMEEAPNGKTRLIVTELPFMVNKASLIEKIAELHKEKKIEGINDLRDESDRTGMRVMIELRKDANPHVVLNRLYKHTQLEDTFGVIMLALVDGQPQVLSLHNALGHYLEHQKDVIIRRTQFELRKAEDRAHILEGLRIALDHIDEIIALIRAAANEQKAKEQLMERFGLSERQATAILEMQLRRLTGLEREKIEEEYQELLKTIARLRAILDDLAKVYGVIRGELLELKKRFADPRRTQISNEEPGLEIEDLIADEDIVVTITHHGYIKRLPVDTYRNQRRGGRGITALTTKAEDFVEHLFTTSTHTYILFFTDKGRVFRLKGHEVPEAGRNARGTAIINLLQIDRNENINAVIPVREYDDAHFLILATRNGVVKKTVLSEYDSPRAGLIAIHLDEDDALVGVRLTAGNEEVIMVTRHGQAIRFPETDVRPMGRSARGVRGITLAMDDRVVGMEAAVEGGQMVVVSTNGYGKRTLLEEYRVTGRGGKGIRTLHATEKTGPVVGVRVVKPEDELMMISGEGVMIRIGVADISEQGRVTQGVKLMRVEPNDTVVAVTKIVAKEDDVEVEEG